MDPIILSLRDAGLGAKTAGFVILVKKQINVTHIHLDPTNTFIAMTISPRPNVTF